MLLLKELLHLKEELTDDSELSLKSKQLTSLKGLNIPDIFRGDFDCSNNQLTTLEFSPQEVVGNFYCSSNKLTSLEHCPNKVKGNVICSFNELSNLKDIHKIFKNGYIKATIRLNHNPITSHILGLILIKELRFAEYQYGNAKCIEAIKIINKHLAGDRDLVECQQELIDAGLKAFAQL